MTLNILLISYLPFMKKRRIQYLIKPILKKSKLNYFSLYRKEDNKLKLFPNLKCREN